MSEPEPQPEAVKPSPSQIRQMLASLPSIKTDLDQSEIARRAKRLSERGKLPGFHPNTPGGLFEAIAFGNPFDYRLIASHQPGQLNFHIKIKSKMPAIFWIVMALTIWPGVLFTDSLLNTWFGWYPNQTWITYAWYLPITIIPLPWLHRSIMAKTRAAALVHAHEQIATLAKALEGDIIDHPQTA